MSKRNTKRVHIITGPPGAGKSTFAAHAFPGLPVYDSDLGNKSSWRDSPTDAVLMTAAPAHHQKDYWLAECKKYGFSDPRLYVCDPGQARTVQQLLARDADANGVKGPRLTRTVQRWYRAYTPHPLEQKVTSNAPDRTGSRAVRASAGA